MTIQYFKLTEKDSNISSIIPQNSVVINFIQNEQFIVLSIASGQIFISSAKTMNFVQFDAFNAILIKCILVDDSIYACGADLVDNKVVYHFKQYSISSTFQLKEKSAEKFNFIINNCEMSNDQQFIALQSSNSLHIFNIKQFLKIKNSTVCEYQNPIKVFKFITPKLVFVQTTQDQFLTVYSLSKNDSSSLKLSNLFEISLYKHVSVNNQVLYGQTSGQLQKLVIKENISKFGTPQEVQNLSGIAKLPVVDYQEIESFIVQDTYYLVKNSQSLSIRDHKNNILYEHDHKVMKITENLTMLDDKFRITQLKFRDKQKICDQLINNLQFDQAIELKLKDSSYAYSKIANYYLSINDQEKSIEFLQLSIEKGANFSYILYILFKSKNYKILQQILQQNKHTTKQYNNLFISVCRQNKDIPSIKSFLNTQTTLQFDLNQLPEDLIQEASILLSSPTTAVGYLLTQKNHTVLQNYVESLNNTQLTQVLTRHPLTFQFLDKPKTLSKLISLITPETPISTFFPLFNSSDQNLLLELFERTPLTQSLEIYFSLLIEFQKPDSYVLKKLQTLPVNYTALLPFFEGQNLQKCKIFLFQKLEMTSNLVEFSIKTGHFDVAFQHQKTHLQLILALLEDEKIGEKLDFSGLGFGEFCSEIVKKEWKIELFLEILKGKMRVGGDFAEQQKVIKGKQEEIMRVREKEKECQGVVFRVENDCQKCQNRLQQPVVYCKCGHSYHQGCFSGSCECLNLVRKQVVQVEFEEIGSICELIQGVDMSEFD